MKKILFMGIIATILSAPTIAAQICAPLFNETVKNVYGGNDTARTTDCVSYDGYLDNFMYTTPTISGVAICSSATQTVSGMLPTISSEAEYQSIVHCWHRVIKPVLSEWIFSRTYDTAVECLKNCALFSGVMPMPYDMRDFYNNIIKNGNQI